MTPGTGSITLKPTAWKTDDAAWFVKNPTRSHRARKLFEGELPTLGSPPENVPPGHEVQVLVRQVEPGKRVRHQFIRNLEAPVPDVESILHALFDLATRGEEGKEVQKSAVVALASSYARQTEGTPAQ